MVENKDLLLINGVKIPRLKEYSIGRNKLWKDATRNMSGECRATLIGVFPTIEITINYCTEAEMQTITNMLDLAFFNVTWYEPKTMEQVTAQYYASDYTISISHKYKGVYKPFNVTLVPVGKRY